MLKAAEARFRYRRVVLGMVVASDVGWDCGVEGRNVRLGGAFILALNL